MVNNKDIIIHQKLQLYSDKIRLDKRQAYKLVANSSNIFDRPLDPSYGEAIFTFTNIDYIQPFLPDSLLLLLEFDSSNVWIL